MAGGDRSTAELLGLGRESQSAGSMDGGEPAFRRPEEGSGKGGSGLGYNADAREQGGLGPSRPYVSPYDQV